MRNIKFRFWFPLSKKMIPEDQSNNYYQYRYFLTLDGDLVEHFLGGVGTSESEHIYPKDEYHLMQFTGLLDKNGKEIYEGDIVTYRYLSGFACEDDDYKEQGVLMKPAVVEFNNGKYFPIEQYDYCDDGFYASRWFDFEVIGNIYQNPELIKNNNA